ncbi:hypothetical protein SAMN02745227_01870 [Anaerobranca californiensis DSM 14826]|jgi:roadblock/LC7 domain-containing protein|uniref:Major membrane immunogen, membrane-anchored lipoprotein n=1 Tax=Anaerobranca californiensis DSM 14826 TaxID=1120989 RepID=A0A1M6QUX1_9FIRM|nr:hypothetical protein [Anaerobranca californiensis]SHK24099.1 hypothetical protein SAMN02745227_01870 [Anaerobranca californiensis DSM 14826]
MKKVLSLLLALTLVAALAVGCTKTDQGKEPEVGAVEFGLGSVSSIAKSRDMTGETTARAQVDTTFAAVSFDSEGRVVTVHIDVAQSRVEFDENMIVTTDRNAKIRTKKDQGNDYGMKRVSNIGKEWYEQIAALENWMVGKTIDEIKALKTKVVDEAHKHVPDIPELTSSVTITVESYIAAVEDAWKNRVAAQGIDKLGLGYEISIAKSRDMQGETLAQAQVDTTMAATAFDKDGKVVGTLIDVAQVRVAFDAEGKVTSDKTAEILTKKKRGDNYGMKRVSNIGKEWYEQIAALENWMVGKTISEITGLKTKVVDDAHQHVPDVPELTSSVTITVESYLAAVKKAFDTKK